MGRIGIFSKRRTHVDILDVLVLSLRYDSFGADDACRL